jgi:parvulin-like peptidyl-prolyl isomerase
MLDGYAATVGDSLITVGDVKEEMQRRNRSVFTAMQTGEQVPDAKLAELYMEALDELIDETLIVNEFERLEEDDKVELPEDAVDSSIQRIISGRYNGSRKDFFEDLKRSGITFAEFKERQRRNIIMMVMRNNQFPGTVSVSPGAVRKLYLDNIDDYSIPAQCEISLIIIKPENEDNERAAKLAKARRLLLKIRAGEAFVDVARAASDGSKAVDGGYRGWMELNNLRVELRNAIVEMKPGEVSGLIEAGESFYIIHLKDLRPATVKPLEEVADELAAELRRAEMDRKMDAWVEELKKKHYVKKHPLPAEL